MIGFDVINVNKIDNCYVIFHNVFLPFIYLMLYCLVLDSTFDCFRHSFVVYLKVKKYMKRGGRERRTWHRAWSPLLFRLFLLLQPGIRLVNGYDKLPNGGTGSLCSNCPSGWNDTGTSPGLRQVVLNWESENCPACPIGYSKPVVAKYGPIEDWDMSEVTSLKYLFYELDNFNADISKWDTSAVTDMDFSTFTHLFYFISFSLFCRITNLFSLFNSFHFLFHQPLYHCATNSCCLKRFGGRLFSMQICHGGRRLV